MFKNRNEQQRFRLRAEVREIMNASFNDEWADHKNVSLSCRRS